VSDSGATTPVVVGIDGSAAATGAAQWVIEEAISHQRPETF